MRLHRSTAVKVENEDAATVVVLSGSAGGAMIGSGLC